MGIFKRLDESLLLQFIQFTLINKLGKLSQSSLIVCKTLFPSNIWICHRLACLASVKYRLDQYQGLLIALLKLWLDFLPSETGFRLYLVAYYPSKGAHRYCCTSVANVVRYLGNCLANYLNSGSIAE